MLAHGDALSKTAERPITVLHRHGSVFKREDRWPTDRDLGLPVILSGGEVGVLRRLLNKGVVLPTAGGRARFISQKKVHNVLTTASSDGNWYAYIWTDS